MVAASLSGSLLAQRSPSERDEIHDSGPLCSLRGDLSMHMDRRDLIFLETPCEIRSGVVIFGIIK